MVVRNHVKGINNTIKDISQTVNCTDLNTQVMEILLPLLQMFGSKINYYSMLPL